MFKFLGLNELNKLLNEKDDQITQLRTFISNQNGTFIENGVKSNARISELESQLQIKGNEYYKLKDEMIKQEQKLKIEIQTLKQELASLVSFVILTS